MKKMIKSLLTVMVNWMISTKSGKSLFDYVLNIVRERTTRIKHKNFEFKITTPNQLCDFRAETFSTKEPETLEWVDSLNENSVLWDIGANVGLYSIYAAKTRKCKVFSFEPSIFNLELLAPCIFLRLVSYVPARLTPPTTTCASCQSIILRQKQTRKKLKKSRITIQLPWINSFYKSLHKLSWDL